LGDKGFQALEIIQQCFAQLGHKKIAKIVQKNPNETIDQLVERAGLKWRKTAEKEAKWEQRIRIKMARENFNR
jgi:hypothetical protein